MSTERGLAVATRPAAPVARAGFDAVKLFTPEHRQVIFNNIAPACKTEADQMQYLATCVTAGLNPLLGDLHAVETSRKETGPDGKDRWIKGTIFVASWKVFVARARAKGWTIKGAVVCERDTWKGWEFGECRPVSHVMAIGDRGAPIIAWARATKVGEEPTGMCLPFHEVAAYKETNGSRVLKGKWATTPISMAQKTIMKRLADTLVSLGDVMCAEEIGEESEVIEASAAKARANVTPETLREVSSIVYYGDDDNREPIVVTNPEVIPVAPAPAPAVQSAAPAPAPESKPAPKAEAPPPAQRAAAPVACPKEFNELSALVSSHLEAIRDLSGDGATVTGSIMRVRPSMKREVAEGLQQKIQRMAEGFLPEGGLPSLPQFQKFCADTNTLAVKMLEEKNPPKSAGGEVEGL